MIGNVGNQGLGFGQQPNQQTQGQSYNQPYHQPPPYYGQNQGPIIITS